jgi:serine/threonine-protein kinase RsbT
MTASFRPDTPSNGQQPETPNPGQILHQFNLQNSLDAVIARATIRKLAASLGFSLVEQVRIATAIFEIAYNLVTYAGQGEIVISWHEADDGRAGLEFFCHDRGLRSSELTTVLQTNRPHSYSQMNLLGLRRLADKFEFKKDRHYGNSVKAVIWKE